MPDFLAELWIGASRWFAGLHREVFVALGGHIRGMDSGVVAWLQAAVFGFALGLLHALTPGHGKAVVFSYFLGQAARPWSGMRMSLQIALVHVGSGVLLFLAVHFVFTTLTRAPLGGVPWLQPLSYGLITLYGLWLLIRGFRQSGPGDDPHSGTGRGGLLPYAVGLLPCPLTLLVLTYAAANATLIGGLLVIVLMTAGIAATIGLVALVGIVTRLLLVRQIEAAGRYTGRIVRALEIGAAIAIIALGGTLLVQSLGRPSGSPFG
jgi:ABC-type nickel/cobalt efflux system permease component RcnA